MHLKSLPTIQLNIEKRANMLILALLLLFWWRLLATAAYMAPTLDETLHTLN
jgi:hypothetical protein